MAPDEPSCDAWPPGPADTAPEHGDRAQGLPTSVSTRTPHRGDATGPDGPGAKDLLRAAVREARALQPVAARREADAARTALLVSRLRESGLPGCVACYLSVDPEPDTTALVAELHAAGVRVLVPLLRGHRHPTFGRYRGPEALRPGLWGIPEPVGAAPVALSEADLVLCSALAATPDGRRLGVGGGWYDRVLPARRPGVPVWALLNDAEVVADLPADAHDQPVQALVTPSRLLACRPVGQPGA